MTKIKLRILRELRHGALDQFQVAGGIGEPAFRVRAELKGLKRDRLVLEHWRTGGNVFELTDRGNKIAWSHDQLRLVHDA